MMDAWEWNKIAAAILCALVLVIALRFGADAVLTPAPLAKPAYVPPVPPPPAPPAAAPASAQSNGDGAAAPPESGAPAQAKPGSRSTKL
ncbi:MAG: hypothetical protein WCD42_08540 [Rhizomicrobium sp.]